MEERASAPKPPMAEKKTKTLNIHGETLVDDFFWLREKSNPAVISYLESENAHTDATMKSTAELQTKLYNEMVSHIKETDENVPYRDGDYFYYSRTVKGLQYPIYARKRGTLDAKEEITLDLNEMAKGLKYLGLGAYAVSDDGNYLAYSTDTTGYRQYTLQIRTCAPASYCRRALSALAQSCGPRTTRRSSIQRKMRRPSVPTSFSAT